MDVHDEPATDIQFRLLENALDFIVNAGYYAKSEADDPADQPRLLKHAVLNLAAGAELLLKERLRREHWSLLFENPDEATWEKFERGDLRSVGGARLIQRLEGVVAVRLSKDVRHLLDSLRAYRNRLEHFQFAGNQEAVRGLVLKVSSFAWDFIHEELRGELEGAEPRLLEEVREVMFDNQAFVETRMAGLRDQLDDAEGEFGAVVSCPRCWLEALVVDGERCRCLFCRWDAGGDARLAAAEEWAYAFTGADPKEMIGFFHLCPECDDEWFANVGTYNEGDRGPGWLCFSCGYNTEEKSTELCSSCGQPYLPASSSIDVMCDRCWRDLMESPHT
jgi:hypothetical protein